MKCPDCEARLEVKRFGTVDIDECRSCGGEWFDEGELERVRAGVHRTSAATFRTTDLPAGNCPRCVEQILFAGFVAVDQVARCRRCHGVWVPKPMRTAQERQARTDDVLGVLEVVVAVLEFFT
jgi:Zn-finger nucleic acid-binding protein